MTPSLLFRFLVVSLLFMSLHNCQEKRGYNWKTSNQSFKDEKSTKSQYSGKPNPFDSKYTVASNIRKISLYSRTGKFLEILPSGRMRGTSNGKSKDTQLEVEIFGIRYRRFRKVNSKKYMAINKYGRPYTQNYPGPDTLFKAVVERNGWTRYQSVKNSWMLAVKRNGRLKKAAKPNGKSQKSTQFLTLISEKTPWTKSFRKYLT